MPTYIAFAADGNYDMYQSDIRYYRLLQAWDAMKNRTFEIINPHEKGSAIREWSKKETIMRTLSERLRKSNRLLLLVGNTTRFDTDFVPFEIEYAIDTCKLPVIVCYVNESKRITHVTPNLYSLLPNSLTARITNERARTLHIPFKEKVIVEAINDYSKNSMPPYVQTIYSDALYNRLYPYGDC